MIFFGEGNRSYPTLNNCLFYVTSPDPSKLPEVLFRMTHKWPIVRFSEETWILIGCLHCQEERWINIPRILCIPFQFHFKVPFKVTGTGVLLQNTWIHPEMSAPFYSDTDSDCFMFMPTRKTEMRKLWHLALVWTRSRRSFRPFSHSHKLAPAQFTSGTDLFFVPFMKPLIHLF